MPYQHSNCCVGKRKKYPTNSPMLGGNNPEIKGSLICYLNQANAISGKNINVNCTTAILRRILAKLHFMSKPFLESFKNRLGFKRLTGIK